ncbi:MAG: hypothetical protein H6854_02070 [Rhodospirillales bacterium]|nr:hypothetical protein [Rhodospirillales bacterium]
MCYRILIAGILLFLGGFSFDARAQQSQPYVVENVKIALKGISPVEARDQALDAAQLKAFKALFRGLNQGMELPFDQSRVGGLVQDFELVDEQITPDRYAATYTFRFKRAATQEMIREVQYAAQGVVPPADGQYSTLFAKGASAQGQKVSLLLPYWKTATGVSLWGGENLWQGTWRRLEAQAAAENGFVLPIGDLADQRELGDSLPENQEVIHTLLARYQTSDLVVAVGERAISSITTTLYKAKDGGLVFWKVIDSPLGPTDDPYSVAAGQVMAEIRGQSNPQTTSRLPQDAAQAGQMPNAAPSSPGEMEPGAGQQTPPFYNTDATPPMSAQNLLKAYSMFSSGKEWVQIRTLLSPENGIASLRVLSLMPRSAVVELQLVDPLPTVQKKLAQQDVLLELRPNGTKQAYFLQRKRR